MDSEQQSLTQPSIEHPSSNVSATTMVPAEGLVKVESNSLAIQADQTYSDDNDPNFVDISMWTQVKSPSVATRQTDVHLIAEASPPTIHDLQDDSVPEDLNDDDERSRPSSPDEVEEIPYAEVAGGNEQEPVELTSDINAPSETITLAQSQVYSEGNYNLQQIKFLEGSEQLRTFPAHVKRQLKDFCQIKQTSYPKVIKVKWPPPNSVLRTRAGNKTWFEDPRDGKRLLAARYQYGKMGQIIVVQSAPGFAPFNEGKPAIIQYNPFRATTREVNKKIQSQYVWDVWDPYGNAKSSLHVWRIIDGIGTPGQTRGSQSLSGTKFPKSHKISIDEKRTPTRRDSFLKGEDPLDAIRPLKRSSVIESSEGAAKKPRLTSSSIDKSLLKPDYPITGTLGARRDKATGEMLLRRKQDGKSVMLRCPDCSDESCDTQQGLFNHLRSVHNVDVVSRDDVVEYCGIVVDEPAWPASQRPFISTTKYTSSTRTRKHLLCQKCSKSLVYGEGESLCVLCMPDHMPRENPLATTSHNHATRRTSQRLATPPANAGFPGSEAGAEDVEPRFVFKRSHNDEFPRIRPLSSINSAEKLFVNAVVAGIAQKGTLMLTVTIEGDDPFYVVKNDKQDFSTILERITHANVAHPTVVITVEDLD